MTSWGPILPLCDREELLAELDEIHRQFDQMGRGRVVDQERYDERVERLRRWQARLNDQIEGTAA